jgi:hypothetical protein
VKIKWKLKAKVNAMTTIQPESENLRKAVKWISDERQYGPAKKLSKLIEEACFKFNLSPADAENLIRFLKQSQ